MALICCMKCPAYYGETLDECPKCGTFNFFADKHTMLPAIDHLCADIEAEAERDQKAKLRELARVRFWMHPPWWAMPVVWVALLVREVWHTEHGRPVKE